jgi:CRP-like cAMP-binding protein
MFGVLSLMEEKTERCYQAVAFTRVCLVSLTRTQWQQALQESPELGLLMTSQLSQRLLQAKKILETLRQRDLLTRLVWYLLLLADDFGIETKSGILIDLKLSHSALAELINSSRPTVTHLLQLLRQEQIVGIEEHKITLYQPEKLSQLFRWKEQALLGSHR